MDIEIFLRKIFFNPPKVSFQSINCLCDILRCMKQDIWYIGMAEVLRFDGSSPASLTEKLSLPAINSRFDPRRSQPRVDISSPDTWGAWRFKPSSAPRRGGPKVSFKVRHRLHLKNVAYVSLEYRMKFFIEDTWFVIVNGLPFDFDKSIEGIHNF